MSETVENHAEHLEDSGAPSPPELPRRNHASQEALNPEEPGFEKVLSEMIEKEVARRFQSAKDKRWAELEKIYGDLHELREQAQTAVSPGVDADLPTEELEPDFEGRVTALAGLPGIRENEDAVALILRNRNPADQAAYTSLVEGLLQTVLGGGEAAATMTASAASMVIPGGGETSNDLEQAYRRRKKLLRPGDVNALTALKREFRQKGLDVF